MVSYELNLEDFKLRGDVLDISFKGNTMLMEYFKCMQDTYPKIELLTDIMKADDMKTAEKYSVDCACAFFSLGGIWLNINLNRVLKMVYNSIKESGRFFIWDLFDFDVYMKKEFVIEAVMPGRKRTNLSFKRYYNPFRPDFIKLLEIIERNGFEIANGNVKENIFYIEAVKKPVSRDENITDCA